MITATQKTICEKFGADFLQVRDTDVVGVARNLTPTSTLLHGLRHPPVKETSGWYIWASEYSDADDFFEPVHAAHLHNLCPQAIDYLGLAPGWRFLIAGDQIDVWYDEHLLKT